MPGNCKIMTVDKLSEARETTDSGWPVRDG